MQPKIYFLYTGQLNQQGNQNEDGKK